MLWFVCVNQRYEDTSATSAVVTMRPDHVSYQMTAIIIIIKQSTIVLLTASTTPARPP